jgi:hypothetical protein
LELAFKAPLERLQGMLNSLMDRGCLPDLNKPPLVVAAASAGRWDVVKMLLELDGVVSVAPLLRSKFLESASKDFQEVVKVIGARGVRASDLKDFFERELVGESMSSDDMIPHRFVRRDGYLEGPHGQKVLHGGVRLGNAGNCLAFVSVTEEELAASCASLDSQELMLPVDFRGEPRQASLNDPQESGCWLAVLCPSNLLGINEKKLQLHISEKMENCVPHPMISQFTVRVIVRTPCCRKTVASVIVHVNGQHAGSTGDTGELLLALPMGQHRLSLPYQSLESQGKVVQVTSGAARLQTVELSISGAFYLFLQKVGDKHAVKLTTNRYKVPVEALPFVGQAILMGSASSDRAPQRVTAESGGFPAMLCVEESIVCAEQLPCHAEPHASYGDRYEPDEEVDQWYGKMHAEGECSVALLFSVQQPMTLGYVFGTIPTSSGAVVKPISSPAPCPCVTSAPVSPGPRTLGYQTGADLLSLAKGSMAPRIPTAPVEASTEPDSQGGHWTSPCKAPKEDRQEDMAMRLVEVLQKTMVSQLRDITERLDSVVSGHQHLEEQLQRRREFEQLQHLKGRRSVAKSSAQRPSSASRIGYRGSRLRSNSMA